MNDLTNKYVISPIDNKQYCRKNGQFLRHLRLCGYENYQYFFESYFPHDIRYCICGQKCNFISSKMRYTETCGNQQCINDAISSNKKQRTKEQIDEFRTKYKNTMKLKPEEIIKQITLKRIQTGNANGSYKASVEKREKTCERKYANKKYNNSKQISQTKLDWDDSRKCLFKERLKLALGGKLLNDFHTEEMYVNRRKMLENRGDIVPLQQLSEWEIYNKKVRRLTERNYRKFKDVINPNNYSRKCGNYELDHIIPVYYGFQNQISEELISSIDNLQMLTFQNNRSKGKKYDPTIS